MKNIFIVLLFSLLVSLNYAKAGNIVDTSDYAYWRELTLTSEMFASMKASAIENSKMGGETSDVMGGGALAYILDPENRPTYIASIQEKFDTRITTMTIGKGAATSSVRSHELWFALLALDVIRYDIDSATFARYDSILERKIMKLVIGKWDPHGWAMRMLYYKFAGDEENFQAAKIEWEIGLSEHYMPNDGVSPAGNGYCVQRWNGIDRTAKNTTTDLMEYMGYNEYYTNPGLIGLKEYMYGYSVAPFGRILLYGDSRSTESQKPWKIRENTVMSPHIVSATRYSQDAYRYAMWVLREGAGKDNPELIGYLSNYIIMAGTAENNNPIEFNTADAVLAPSRTFKNYGVLISDEQSTNGLCISMLNLTGNVEYHTNYETNAIAMAGYGEILMRNSGYDGPGNDCTVDGVTATFDFIHSNSESSNTLMIGGKRHSVKTGEGIIEGIVGTGVEYLRGSSSTAIDGTHFRDVVFIQPANGVNGYYVVMDHVTTNNTGDTVNVVWHPNASILNTIKKETEYFSEIKIEEGALGPRLFSDNKATLKTLLATTPASVDVKRTANQSRAGYAYAGDYLYVNYSTSNNKADILTVFFPGDKTHETGDMKRIAIDSYSGAQIIQKDIEDIALTSDGLTTGTISKESFQGEDIFYRKSNGKLVSYFVKGSSFIAGKKNKTGFKSDTPVTINLNKNDDGEGFNGKVISSGAKVSFYYPEISSVKLNGESIPVDMTESNCAMVTIPQGAYTIELVGLSNK